MDPFHLKSLKMRTNMHTIFLDIPNFLYTPLFSTLIRTDPVINPTQWRFKTIQINLKQLVESNLINPRQHVGLHLQRDSVIPRGLILLNEIFQPDIIHLLLHHACSVNDQDPLTGRTALHWAVLHRDQSTVKRLLHVGIDPDLRDVDWNTAFLMAANLGDRQMARLLVEAGSDVSVTDKSFSTALHLSSRDGHEELIPIFVESGLNLDLKGPGGLTPLMLGAYGGHEKVVQALLAFGARPNLLDRNRASAMVY